LFVKDQSAVVRITITKVKNYRFEQDKLIVTNNLLRYSGIVKEGGESGLNY
jgi:hypothetical protein